MENGPASWGMRRGDYEKCPLGEELHFTEVSLSVGSAGMVSYGLLRQVQAISGPFW